MTNSRILLFLCISVVLGIFLNSFAQVSQLVMLGFLISGLILVSVFLKCKKVAVFGFCLVFFSLGMWRSFSFESKINGNELQNYFSQRVELAGIVSAQPAEKGNSTRLEIEMIGLEEKVLATVSKYSAYAYGDRIKVSGILEEPPVFEDFDYRQYLAGKGVYGLMFFPEIEVVGKKQGNRVMNVLFSLKDELKQSLNGMVPLPESALMEGLLFGDEESFSDEWIEKFNVTGTRHITAVSGMNITILSALVLNFLLALGLWRRQAFYLSIVLIIFYTLMIGAPASGIRAAIMGIIFLAAQHFGRASNAVYAIVFSAALMLVLNPLLLKDVGFQLSFLAVMGLVWVQSFFMELFKKVPDRFELRYSLSATIAAQMFTLPVLVCNFGRISLVSPFANVFIVPLLSPITIAGFVASFLGIFSRTLGLIFCFPVILVLKYMLKIIDLCFALPFVNFAVENAPWIIIPFSYIALFFAVRRIREKQRLRFLPQ